MDPHLSGHGYGTPSLNGHDTLLMIVDRFSKAIIPITCNVKLSAEGWAQILREHVYARHGMADNCNL